MSSINASERARQQDAVSQARDEYQNRENDEVKRHRKEIKRLAEKNDQEIEKIKEAYEKQLATLRDRSNEQLSEKDQINNAKIEKLKSMYLDSLKRKTNELETRRTAETSALAGQLLNEKRSHDQQTDVLTKNFDDSMAEASRNFEDYATRARDDMREAMQTRTENLNKKHESELKSVIADRDENVLKTAETMRNVRQNLEERNKDQKRVDDLKYDRAQAKWESLYKEKESEANHMVRGKDEALQMEADSLRRKFNHATQSKLNEIENAHERLKADVSERLDRDVKAVESENRRIKNDHLVDVMNAKRLKDLERKHVIENYEDKLGKLAATKDGQLNIGKELNAKRISEAAHKNDLAMQETTRRYRNEQMINNERHNEDREALVQETKAQVENLSNRQDRRVNALLKSTTEEMRIQDRQHLDTVDALKANYQNELSRQRVAQMQQLKDTYLRMDERVRTAQDKLTQKLEDTVAGYEQKINQLQEQHKKELQKQAESFEMRMAAQKKSLEGEQKSSELKSDMKLTQLQEQHDREVERLQKRHQEQMAALAQKLSYYKKS